MAKNMAKKSRFNHRKYQPFTPVSKANRRWPEQTITQAPVYCSVDLRDGNQALVEPMSVEQKKQLFALLVKMGFKEIEIGFPAASQPDYDFVRWLIENNQIPEDVTVQALTQARDEQIERTFEALKGVERAIVHLYNSTSPVQRERVFKTNQDGVLEIAAKGAQKVQQVAHNYPLTDWVFQYSPESFSSTEVEFSVAVCNAVSEVWKPSASNKVIYNLPSTVEVSMPNRYADQIEWFCDHINLREHIIVSVHTHNDRGCAIAAGEMAVLAGADRVEGTLIGNGERTGNMDLFTFAMNLYSQGVDPKVDLTLADEVVATVESCTNIKTHPRHPWLGELVYTAFSGSHQDAIRKCLEQQQDDEPWQVAYLPINPEDIGRTYQSVIRVNSQSGKGGASYLLEQSMGVKLPRWVQIELAQPVQKLAEKQQGEIKTEEIEKLFVQTFLDSSQHYQLAGYQVDKQDNSHRIQASINHGSDLLLIHGKGSGAVSAFVNALHKSIGVEIHIRQFDEKALTKGSDADAIAFVQAKINGKKYHAAARDSDTLSASLMAILVALDKSQD